MSHTIKSLLECGTNHLSNISQTPVVDSQYLLAHLLQVNLAYLYRAPDTTVDKGIGEIFFDLIEQRKRYCPVAYLIGKKPFWSFELTVNSNTLVPRPETEHLVELALEKLPKSGLFQVADLGTGSGAIALAIAQERLNGYVSATDLSASALETAQNNAEKLAISNIQFYLGDWYQALPKNKRYNLIVSNPPYISRSEVDLLSPEVNFEPTMALFSEEDGLKDLQKIISQSPHYLEKKGWLMVEHGFLQAESIRFFFREAGFQSIFTQKDYADCERVTGGTLI